jgi:hypothetical protein
MAAARTVGHHTGEMRDGDLHVMMDVGLADEVGMSVAELREAINSMNFLKTENDKLKKELRQLKDEVKELKYSETETNGKMDDFVDSLNSLMSKFDDQTNEEVEEADEGEPGIALEDQLRITEQSAKAIDLLTNHLLSTVWQSCSKNTFGIEFGSWEGGAHLGQRLTYIFCRFLYSHHAAQWIVFQKATDSRHLSPGDSWFSWGALFGSNADCARLLPVDETARDISRRQRRQCIAPNLSWNGQWGRN